MNLKDNFNQIKSQLPSHVKLIAVSKTKPVELIQEAFDSGQMEFGENYVQELCDKVSFLPLEIRWHFIGHLQSNKVKYIAPFVSLIHGVDSIKLLKEINKQAEKNNRIIDCLLQIHIASEETKFGFNKNEISSLISSGILQELKYVRIIGFMGMASNTENKDQIRSEFKQLKSVASEYPQFPELSMGMSSDYTLAVEEGSTMIRIGSLLFGSRNYS